MNPNVAGQNPLWLWPATSGLVFADFDRAVDGAHFEIRATGTEGTLQVALAQAPDRGGKIRRDASVDRFGVELSTGTRG